MEDEARLPVAMLRVVLALRAPVGRRDAPQLREGAGVGGVCRGHAGRRVLHLPQVHPEVVDFRAHGHHIPIKLLLRVGG
eukprot:15106698-Alexandrium_andersonii.AAC.1